jgi:general secretion pathway protein C
MLSARLPIFLAIILCIILAGVFSWQLLPFYKMSQNPNEINSTSTNNELLSTKKNRKTAHNIAAFQLFGNSAQKTKQAAPVNKVLPKTTLKLTLTGVLVSDNIEEAGALIQGPDKETINYKINDELPGGATLKQVFHDRVVVERSGRLENLVFIETRPIGIQAYNDPNEVEDNLLSNRPPPPTKTNSPLSPARTQSIKDRLSKLRKRMLKNRP